MSEALHELDPEVIVRPMLTINLAIDLFAGDLARRGCSDRTRYTYIRLLGLFADRLPDNLDVTRITSDDCRRFLDLYNRRADGTKVHVYTVLSSFFKWLIQTEQTKRSPMSTIPRPRRRRSEDLDVTTVTASDVRKLLAAANTWTERLAVAIPAYLGPRRRAIARLRLSDYDRARGRLRFQEKGGKTIWKPVPDELANMLEAAIKDGAIVALDDYLVPPEGHLSRPGVRDDRVIWRVVKRVASRAGVDTHVHALRAAFAVAYLEQHPGDTYGAQQLLGHVNPQTTQVYLRKLDKDTVMERVRDLSWDTPERGDDAEVGEAVGGGEAAARGARAVRERAGALVQGGDEVAAMREKIALLESRLATAEAANQRLTASGVVGAGGFEPPHPDSSIPEPGCGPHLVSVLADEARSASSEATPEGVA